MDFLKALLYQPGHPLLFNSVMFGVLFTGFYFLYVLSSSTIKLRNTLLLMFSLLFYYKVSGLFVFMLMLMAASDYFIGMWMYYLHKQWQKRVLFILSIVVNIGYLAYFKYARFILDSFGIQLQQGSEFVESILLPIGMSYFVFRSLTYIFDLYREIIEEPETNYFRYLLYISFFPTLLAGPIARARDLLPQFSSKLKVNDEMIGRGLFLIFSGAFKKIVLSDFIAVNFVDRVFDGPTLFSGFENLMAAYGATLQIYCDFSGYTDMVIGIALLLGFTLPSNFNKPFLAVNISDFWRRWHMTLSSWMSDYVFYPISFWLRGIRKVGIVIAVLITFVVSGLWHGPNVTFIIWGGLHGLAIAYDVLTQEWRYKLSKRIPKSIYRFISIIITFHFVVFTIVLFKVNTLQQAQTMYQMMFTQTNWMVALQWVHLYRWPALVMLIGLILHYLPFKWNEGAIQLFIKTPLPLKVVAMFIALLAIYQAFSSATLPFVYLEF